METFEEQRALDSFEAQKAFFDRNWEAMQKALEEGGARAVVEFIEGFEAGIERRVLFLFARQGVVMSDWKGKNLDAVVEVARAGIQEMQRAASGAEDETRRQGLTHLANVISYNLTADLADCWPDDDIPRTTEHFKAGAQAAEDCIRWREELGTGPGDLSAAWWAKGMHELSLGRPAEARASWEKSLAYAEEAADDDRAFPVVLGRGYLGLVRWIQGDDEGRRMFRGALAAFASQLFDKVRKEDARFGIDQLETVMARYGPVHPAD